MKTMLKLTLMVAFLGTSVLADGDMNSGNRSCPPEGCPPPCTQNCVMAQAGDDGTEAVSDAIVAGTDLAVDLVNETLGLF